MTYKPTDEAVEKLAEIYEKCKGWSGEIKYWNKDCFDRVTLNKKELLEAIRADLNAYFPVKELEWQPSICGTKQIAFVFGKAMYEVGSVKTNGFYIMHNFSGLNEKSALTLDLAKAAAQSHYAALADGVRL